LALILGAIPDAQAHDQQFEISGRQVKMDTSRDPIGHKVKFTSTKEQGIFPQHDPAAEGSALLVRWTGQGGVAAGRTSLIQLDPASWKGLGNPPGSKGYKYLDKLMTRGGIRTVQYKSTGNGGSLKISARGANWAWELGGPHDAVWVHFQVEDEWYCAEFGGDVTRNEPGRFTAKNALAPAACPEQVCGNGITELGEECDDGNLIDDDGCNTDCTIGSCTGEVYDSTYEAIQAIVFDSPVYGCNSAVCHGATPGQGQLDLRDGSSYANLIGVASSVAPGTNRVEPGEPVLSVLHDKLAAATNSTLPTFGGTPMPSGATPLTPEHLEAIEIWIRGGAPEDLVVEGTSALLATCLPDPDPLVIPPLPPPGQDVGAQFRQTAWPLPSQTENEICMSTYYDLTQTNLVPESAKISCTLGAANNPTGECFVWHKQTLAQDPKSHHSIINLYNGAYGTTNAGWGSWTYKFQDESDPMQGQSCDPTDVDPATGYHADCSSTVVTSIACIGYGPPDNSFLLGPGFSGSQEPYYEQEFADGVYSVLPMAGIVIWNSHAFNTTSTDSTMSQYLNLEFAGPADQVAQSKQIFDTDDIFIQDVPAFETREYCANYTIPKDTNLFTLSSHTHRHGVRFRVWGPPNASCTSGGGPGFCGPGSPAQLIYTSTDYSDPVQKIFDPPVHYGNLSANDRRFRFCSLYDNGAGPGSPAIKRNSNPIGSGCGTGSRSCVAGPSKGLLCGSNDAFCDSSPGAGDGECDACPVDGGFTTEDEMFILIGGYYDD
jgi:cysteine-rich repeat protein